MSRFSQQHVSEWEEYFLPEWYALKVASYTQYVRKTFY